VEEGACLRRLPDAAVGAARIVVVPLDDEAMPPRRCNISKEAEEELRLIEP